MARAHIVVVGAGLSGLAACLEAERNGCQVTLIEASDRVGGRVKTDQVQGCLLDRGFQVLSSSYPELMRLDVMDELELAPFVSGARCWIDQTNVSLFNPLAHPIKFLSSIPQVPAEYYLDFVRLAVGLVTSSTGLSTRELLHHRGVSESFTRHFLTPFFGGVFLDSTLSTRGSLFQQYLKGFIFGKAMLPRKGMEALPLCLFHRLKQTKVMLKTKCVEARPYSVRLEAGGQIQADAVVLALDNPSLARLVELPEMDQTSCEVSCYYHMIDSGKIQTAGLLQLGAGRIANLCVPNQVQSSYARPGVDLISSTVFNNLDCQKEVQDEISSRFGVRATELRFLRRYHIRHALPSQTKPPYYFGSHCIDPGLFLAGEQTEDASINGALVSGRKAILSVVNELNKD